MFIKTMETGYINSKYIVSIKIGTNRLYVTTVDGERHTVEKGRFLMSRLKEATFDDNNLFEQDNPFK